MNKSYIGKRKKNNCEKLKKRKIFQTKTEEGKNLTRILVKEKEEILKVLNMSLYNPKSTMDENFNCVCIGGEAASMRLLEHKKIRPKREHFKIN